MRALGLSPPMQQRLDSTIPRPAAANSGAKSGASGRARPIQCCRRCRCRSRPLPLLLAAAASSSSSSFDSDPLAALDKAAALLNRAIGSAENKNNNNNNKKKGGPNKPAKKRWVSFSASATAAVAVAPLLQEAAARDHHRRRRGETEGEQEGERESRKRIPGRDLLAYLALPASEYSLLDPTWVTREGEEDEEEEEEREEGRGERDEDIDRDDADAANENADENASSPESFIVRFPFADLVGIPLTPSFRVRVKHRSPTQGIVAFAADRAALGDPVLDPSFEAGVDATLSKKKSKKVFAGSSKAKKKGHDKNKKHQHQHQHALDARSNHGKHAAAAEAETAAAAEEQHHHNDDEDDGEDLIFYSADDASSSLSAHVTIKAKVQLSGPAASLPGPLVSLAAKLVARAVLAATLGPFLNLLVNDYWSWSVGLDRGELMTLNDAQKTELRLQVAQATAEMVQRKEEEDRKRSRAIKEEAARGEGEVIEL